jgi:hypothetical protein
MILMNDIEATIKKYGYINFEPANEKWSVYCLKDKTIIKLKVIPLKFFKKDDKYGISSMVVTTSFSPPTLKGEPSTTPIPITEAEKAKALKEIDMKFDVISEPWNEYALDGGIKVSIKTVATSISSTSYYDPEGEPGYLVNHQALTKKYPP